MIFCHQVSAVHHHRHQERDSFFDHPLRCRRSCQHPLQPARLPIPLSISSAPPSSSRPQNLVLALPDLLFSGRVSPPFSAPQPPALSSQDLASYFFLLVLQPFHALASFFASPPVRD